MPFSCSVIITVNETLKQYRVACIRKQGLPWSYQATNRRIAWSVMGWTGPNRSNRLPEADRTRNQNDVACRYVCVMVHSIRIHTGHDVSGDVREFWKLFKGFNGSRRTY
jgi:hypothetical protein